MKARLRSFALHLIFPAALMAQAAEPLIVIDGVPLTDAIKNLARHADINYILDPRVPGSQGNGGGLEPTVTARWTNATAQESLQWTLRQHQLAAITNSSTRITRIAPAKLVVAPVSTNQVSTNNSQVIAVITFESMPVADAIQQLCGAAGVKASLHPKVVAELSRSGATLTARWQNVTAGQALAAVLDNYSLALTEGGAGGSAEIRFTNGSAKVTR